MARGVAGAAALITPGFWCERFVYRSAYADVLVSWTTVAARGPVRAVRLISADAREMAAGLPERERQRVLGWVSGQGQAGAMGALHRGEPCGLALNCGGAWMEWSARAVFFLPLVSCTEPLCSRRADQTEGFGSYLRPRDGSFPVTSAALAGDSSRPGSSDIARRDPM
ncbi:hypothetical protein ACH4SK_14385 [Streptomyces inhibens]|uniref:hypothetical protein n=1 Tax=Streptomyces inhibens TaxID=2293571 RepID=UPI00379ADD49